jgi:hypothetical protein
VGARHDRAAGGRLRGCRRQSRSGHRRTSWTEGFEKVAERSLPAQPAEQTLTFPVREARYVKLRVLSGASETDLEIAEVRVLESARAGYVPLFTRAPDVKHWKGSPRDAAQRGLEWIQQAAVNWNDLNSVSAATSRARCSWGRPSRTVTVIA